MNVIKCKRFILNTGMLLVSTSHFIISRCITICLTTLAFMIVKNRLAIELFLSFSTYNAVIESRSNSSGFPPGLAIPCIFPIFEILILTSQITC